MLKAPRKCQMLEKEGCLLSFFFCRIPHQEETAALRSTWRIWITHNMSDKIFISLFYYMVLMVSHLKKTKENTTCSHFTGTKTRSQNEQKNQLDNPPAYLDHSHGKLEALGYELNQPYGRVQTAWDRLKSSKQSFPGTTTNTHKKKIKKCSLA